MPTREEMVAAGKRAVAAGNNAAANEIADAITKLDGGTPAASAQPVQQAEPEQSGINKFLTGVTRLPQLVGIGGDAGEAWGKVGQGAATNVYATARAATDVLGPVDDWVIGGAKSLIDKGNFDDAGKNKERSERLAEELRSEHADASLLGDVMGFGFAGKALRSVGAARGVKIGVAGEAAAVTGAHSLAQGEGIEQAAQDAALAGVLGKAGEVVLNKTVKPIADWAAPRIERALTGKTGRASEEFQIPEGDIQRLANRLKMPAEEVRANVDEYVKLHGRTPDILSVVNKETAEEFGNLARSRKEAAGALREGEEAALLERPDQLAASVRRTGDSQTAAEATDDVLARGEKQVGDAKTAVQDEMAETADTVTKQKRMVSDTAKADVATAKDDIAISAEELSGQLQNATKGIDSEEAIEASLKKYTDEVMRRDGGLAQQEVRMSRRWIGENLPEDTSDIGKILNAKAKTLPAGEERAALLRVSEDLAAENTSIDDVVIKLGDLDTIRRALSQGGTDVNGIKYNLGNTARALTRLATDQVPDYAEKYLKVFAGTQRALAARKTAAMALGKNANSAAQNIEGRVARTIEQNNDPEWIKAGARDGALSAIAGTTKDGAQALKTAAQILRNADDIRRIAGDEGQRIVETVRRTMDNVASIREEIADITARAQTTREALSDGLVTRLATLRRAGATQINAIKAAVKRDQRAIDAASQVLSKTEGELAAATAGTDINAGAVARESIAGAAGASPEGAIRTAQALETPSTIRKVRSLAGDETADTLEGIGRTSRREVENKSIAAARTEKDGPISAELSVAMEAAASLTGRAGPGYMASIVRRGVAVLQRAAISNRAAKALVQATLRQDRAFIEKVLNRVAKTERQRKVIVDALKQFAVGAASGAVTSER